MINIMNTIYVRGFPDGSDSKESTYDVGDLVLIPGLGRRDWLPTPVFLAGEFHGQRSLVGSSPWGCKELDVTERLTHTHVTCENCQESQSKEFLL